MNQKNYSLILVLLWILSSCATRIPILLKEEEPQSQKNIIYNEQLKRWWSGESLGFAVASF